MRWFDLPSFALGAAAMLVLGLLIYRLAIWLVPQPGPRLNKIERPEDFAGWTP